MPRKYLEKQLASFGDLDNPVLGIKKIRGEASTRVFYRVSYDGFSRVAMVYPAPAGEEIKRICRLTEVYREHGLNVPKIYGVIDDRVIVQEDLGDMLVQKAYAKAPPAEKDAIIETVADILTILYKMDTGLTDAVLDTARMKGEMDFFLTHFAPHFLTPSFSAGNTRLDENLKENVHALVDAIAPIGTFAHRDFHCRNMLMHENGKDKKAGKSIYLVDYQDSLVGPPYYDLVSFGFDAYLDLKQRRALLCDKLTERGIKIDDQQFYLTALQRNIKALGTFGYQVTVRKNLAYKKYIDRTLRYVRTNPFFERFFHTEQFNCE